MTNPRLQKKVCMLGSFAVGKTSLVARFVHSIFSERYLTTVGVKIDKKEVRVDGREVTLILWDLHGDDEYQRVRVSYLRGAAGLLLVVDTTRRATLDQALVLAENVREELGEVPLLLLLNKTDLAEEWDLEDDTIEQLEEAGWGIVRTSAKTGDRVEDAFRQLTRRMIRAPQGRDGLDRTGS